VIPFSANIAADAYQGIDAAGLEIVDAVGGDIFDDRFAVNLNRILRRIGIVTRTENGPANGEYVANIVIA
jgi:hypothetical protein